MDETKLKQENITKLFFRYTIPTVFGMMILGLNTIVDGFFVGHYIGSTALACVNIALPFSSLMLALSIVIGIGMLTVMGHSMGAGQQSKVQDTFKTAMLLILLICGGVAVMALLCTQQLALLLGATPQLMTQVTDYIRIIALLLPFLGLVVVLDYALKISGHPVYAMLALAAAVVSHMLLNYCFIARWGWGIQGAAWATGLAYVIASLMALIPFFSGTVKLKLWSGRFDPPTARRIFYCGSSEGVGEIGVGVTTFLLNLALLKQAGADGVAAFTAVGYLSMVGVNLFLGIADGVSSIISYNHGQGRNDRVFETLKLSMSMVLLTGIAMFTVILFTAPVLIALFIDAQQSDAYGFAVAGAKLYAYAFLLSGLNILATGYFTAIGKPRQAALIALSRGVVWVGAGLVVLTPLFGSKGIWLAVPAAEAITLFISVLLVYRHRLSENSLTA